MLDPEKEERARSHAALLPRFGEVVAAIAQRFETLPVLGVVVVDAAPLASIEQDDGFRARDEVIANLGKVVHELTSDRLGEDCFVVAGETGRLEIIALAFRGEEDRAFYRDDLLNVGPLLENELAARRQRLAYPYRRNVPPLGVGVAATVRNPIFGADTQLRHTLEEARRDAQLSRGLMLRERRQGFLDVLLGGRVSSVYEPIVSVEEKTVYGYEALARGPAGTEFHSPLALFGAAEEEGLVFELDCLCRQTGLDGATELTDGTHLFLNVRPTTIHDPKFRPESVIRTLERSGLRPQNVVFEISEQESISSFERFREIRDEYRSLGFRFALDDTGAGYASLQAVFQLEPEFIKVDRAFVSGLDLDKGKQVLLRAFQEVATSMGSKIIGEGLDTLEELGMLEELGIAFGQGWLFGKPTPLRAGS